ncbi:MULTISPECIES: alpha/beta hydrolase [unclassified Legionella]|uniref:alpha/beta hydrolase n=1 Tax=unclassified Legionella TaxID=2622702 RepID=UPI001E4E052E|nr:alpha/beta hydrolase [Legionella sp. 31fI33]MCC5014336.1 alpha/beta hydrolase [Legionella sp. 31fI33]
MLKHVIITILFVFLIALLIIYYWQRNLIYFPAREQPERHAYQAGDMQQITLHTVDALSLNAWYKPAASEQPTLLFLHGNAGHIGHRMPFVRQFLASGFGVLLLEYRGYGGNQGQPTEQGLYQDGRAAVQFLLNQGVRNSQLIFYGESLGTGVATELATEFPICALILQSPYTSMSAVARFHYPWLLISPWDKYDSLARIQTIHAPLLILHGKQDRIIPYEQGLILFEQANQPKHLVSIADRGHNDLWSPYFTQEIKNFISTNCH